jgi:2'-5' RNA ligase
MNTEEIQTILTQWHEECKAKYQDVPEKCFLRPQVVHVTLLMLPLENEEAIEKAREALAAVEPKIKEKMLAKSIDPEKGIVLEFEGLRFFGSEEKTRVIYMKLKEEGEAFEFVKDIVDLLVKECLERKVLEKHQLSHCNYNKQTERYELEQLHLTIVNSSWAGQRQFNGAQILADHGEGKFNFPPVRLNSLQISTRFHYEESGFYLS